jgi:hypothetical protein
MLVIGAAAALLSVTAGCSSSSSSAESSDVASDVILGSSALPPTGPSRPATSPSSIGPPAASSPPVNDSVPQVPPGAVMAATVVVDSGPFKGTSRIQSTGSVGCSYSLFGDKQWRIDFSSEGEFESKDTTASGRHVISFGVTTQDDGTADVAVTYTDGAEGQDLEDKHGVATVRDDGSNVTFTYLGRNGDGTLFHGAALCSKALRSS